MEESVAGGIKKDRPIKSACGVILLTEFLFNDYDYVLIPNALLLGNYSIYFRNKWHVKDQGRREQEEKKEDK